MNVKELKTLLSNHSDSPMHFVLPNGTKIPPHYHITEVGRIQRDFIDCGGTKRSVVSCLLQLWVADDTDHRLTSMKFNRILSIAEPILQSDSIPVEVEYQADFVSQFPISSAEHTAAGFVFQLGTKQTDCLARDKCGVGPSKSDNASACCSGPNCC